MLRPLDWWINTVTWLGHIVPIISHAINWFITNPSTFGSIETNPSGFGSIENSPNVFGFVENNLIAFGSVETT